MVHPAYQPSYSGSHALIIGIDKYAFAPPLRCARNDAEAIARTVVEQFEFPQENVALLLDEQASRRGIRSAYLRFATDVSIQTNDRILIFFAGHGFTFAGRRGETGFLVPADGNPEDLSTLIDWNDLTRNADLIAAKHILFLMDACYGGLALSRRPLAPGSKRFLKDMLQRYTRQVLTSGKADEVVADAGGVRAGHSIFTAHVLDALEGEAATPDGVLTANRLMAYVYERVANDQRSRQTPHFGFIDGDGDFVFDTSPLLEIDDDGENGKDLLIEVSTPTSPTAGSPESTSETMKRLLAEPREQIRLDDYISAHLRRAIQQLDLANFPTSGVWSDEELVGRLKNYEKIVEDLQTILILIARWATPAQIPMIEKIFARLAEADKGSAGTVAWIRLNWYPINLLMYSAGISAISAQNFLALRATFLTRIRTEHRTGTPNEPLIVPTTSSMSEIFELFKRLPGHERHLVPRSEYIFKILQPPIEDVLFLGSSYESYFDEFEILWALIFAELRADGGIWGPPGRFAWKQRRSFGESPLDQTMQIAKEQGDSWGPIKAGLFRGSIARFEEIATQYRDLITKSPLR